MQVNNNLNNRQQHFGMAKVSVPSFKKGKNFATLLFGTTILESPIKPSKYLIAFPKSQTYFAQDSKVRKLFGQSLSQLWIAADNIFTGEGSTFGKNMAFYASKIKTGKNASVGELDGQEILLGEGSTAGMIKTRSTLLALKGAKTEDIIAEDGSVYLEGATTGDVLCENIHMRNGAIAKDIDAANTAIVEEGCTTGDITARSHVIDENAKTGKQIYRPSQEKSVDFCLEY